MPRPLPLAGEIPLCTGDLDTDLKFVSRNREAERITSGLSLMQKMPCPSWGIPATRCKIGSVLAQKPGSTCSSCYALKGRYRFDAVQAKLEQRYQGLFDPLWTPAMVFLINWYAECYFRWFDSGDLVSVNHLRNVMAVATATPQVSHWLPTRETETVRAVLKEVGEFPPNQTVRVSATMIDEKPPRGFSTTSTVVRDPEEPTCRAPDQGGMCGGKCEDCRHCWDASISYVAYLKH